MHDEARQDTMRLVFEAAPNALLLVDAEGLILLANHHAETLFGYPRAELVGNRVELLVPERFRGGHPEQRATWFAAPAARAMGAGRDLYGRRRDGSEMPIEIGLSPVRTPAGLWVLAAVIDITQRKQAEDRVRASLEEKEILLREIHHRVKNNMQVIGSMLSLQASYVDEPRYRQMFAECEARVRAMALIHEKLYGAVSLATIEFAPYVRELVRMLLAAHPTVDGLELEFDTEPVVFDLQTAIPVALILNELVLNALKHAFPAGARRLAVAVRCPAPQRCLLVVRDDGPGLPPGGSRGLGMRIVRGLVRQLDGTLTEHRDGTPGAHLQIEFPWHAKKDSQSWQLPAS